MEITFLGQAGLFIETKHGTVLCDPWFNPAYYASWFPFPNNEEIDLKKIEHPTYLYISHLHYDHCDRQFLSEHVWKETTVLLPDYPLNSLERTLRSIGFTKFIKMKNCEPVTIGELRFITMALVAPNDGASGDSSLILDDGEIRIFNQNDSKPVDLDVLNSFGPYDVHFLQFSGASWYPMVYQFPEKMMQALGRKKRENQMLRALRYIQQIGASFVIPSSGPPCFLDDHLFELNDFNRDPTNVFPDQTVFLEYLQSQGIHNAHLMIQGSIATFSKNSCTIQHALPDEEIQTIFTEKRTYLEAYKARKDPLIKAIKATWSSGQVDILSSLRDWFEPLLEEANLICAGVNGRLLLDCDVQKIIIDFQQRRVYAWSDEDWDYRFHIEAALVESCILQHEEDWVNDLFLSCRFQAQRKGPFNEYLYNFFRSLSLERIQYVENYYKQQAPVDQLWESHGYRIQRRCPHLKSDLTRFAKIENGILTCTLHGWQFELATGRCLTSDGYRLYTQPITQEDRVKDTLEETKGLAESNGSEFTTVTNEAAVFLRKQCKDCWYIPKQSASPKL